MKHLQDVTVADRKVIFIDEVGFKVNMRVIEGRSLIGARAQSRVPAKRTRNKFLPPYSPFFNGIECMFSEWKHHVKVCLQGHNARDEADLQERTRAFKFVPVHVTAYCRHIGNNCLSFI
jgi:hypothetical protein